MEHHRERYSQVGSGLEGNPAIIQRTDIDVQKSAVAKGETARIALDRPRRLRGIAMNAHNVNEQLPRRAADDDVTGAGKRTEAEAASRRRVPCHGISPCVRVLMHVHVHARTRTEAAAA